MELGPLAKIATLNGTDKVGLHNYAPVYDGLLADWRDRDFKLLEIGIGGYRFLNDGGNSLASWRDYFFKAEITGIDIFAKGRDLGPRVQMLQGSQVDPAFLAQIVSERGPFDLIIDDGSHQNDHVVASLEILWPTLAPGGIYIIEDLQTAFYPDLRGGSIELTAPNSVGRLRDIFLAIGTEDALPDLAGMMRTHNIAALFKTGPGTPEIAKDMGWSSLGKVIPADTVWREQFGKIDDTDALFFAPDQADEDLARQFVELDHVEMVVNYPDTPISAQADKIVALMRGPDGTVMVKGDNSYPSNYGYDLDHPMVAANIAAMSALLSEPGAPPEGVANLAEILATRGAPDAAEPWIDRLVAEDNRTLAGLKLRLERATRQKNAAERETVLRHLVTLFPELSEGHLKLCELLYKKGKSEEALSLTRKAQMLYPGMIQLPLLEIRILRSMGRDKDALYLAQMTVDTAVPEVLTPALIALGDAQLRCAQIDAARETLQRAIDHAPEKGAQAHRLLAQIHHEAGEQDLAWSHIGQAIKLQPKAAEYQKFRDKITPRKSA